MKRWFLWHVIPGTFLVFGLGAFVALGIDPFLAARAETVSAVKLSQVSPPGSTTQKKPTMPTAQAPQAAPVPSAPSAAKPKAAGPGWAVNCKSTSKEKGLECRMSQTVVLKQSGQVLTNVTFRIPVDTKQPEIIVQLPLGVLLAAGATFQVDENTPQQLKFKACDRNGCYANSPVTPEVLAILKKGKQLTIGFQNLAEKPITVPLSLDGFGDAYDKMQRPS